MGGAVDNNITPAEKSQTMGSAALRKKGMQGVATSSNAYSRETPAKKGFFGSVIENKSNDMLGGTPA